MNIAVQTLHSRFVLFPGGDGVNLTLFLAYIATYRLRLSHTLPATQHSPLRRRRLPPPSPPPPPSPLPRPPPPPPLSPPPPPRPQPRLTKANCFGDGSLFVVNFACRLLVEALDPADIWQSGVGKGIGKAQVTREGFALALQWSLEVSEG